MSSDEHETRPLCFVLMPFGRKSDDGGTVLDFDAIYEELIKPAMLAARLEPVRADEELTGGIIHKPMFERLLLCDYAVADLTTANENVYYELGVRHATRPWSTVLIFARGTRLPFDLAPARALPYRLDGSGAPRDAEADGRALSRLLEEARGRRTDSPVFQLVDNLPPPDISRLKTDVFRDQVDYSQRVKAALARARRRGAAEVRDLESRLGPLEDVETGILIDLLLSYRAVEAWSEMSRVVEVFPEPVARTTLVREQYAFALNREGRGEEAEQVLLELLRDRGASSETYGILGRVYKDRWEEAFEGGRDALARGLLEKALDAYLKGFEADWRDAYPGINVVTLMELGEPPDPRQKELLPVVEYSVRRRLQSGEADYWDHATLLELAVLGRDRELAGEALSAALASVREPWEPKTTLRNLRLIHRARDRRGQAVAWTAEIDRALEEAAQAR